MTSKINQKRGVIVMKNKVLFIALIAILGLLLTSPGTRAQTPSPSPTPSGSDEKVVVGGYEIVSSVELGVRGLEVNGNDDKYRSDFNYRPGFRIFDSSLLMEATEGNRDGFFDSLLINSSGWGADPNGFVRLNMEKLGWYRLDTNVRRVHYFNRVNNHINVGGEPGWKGADTKRNYGDFDVTIFPQNEKLRFRLGASFYRVNGSAGFTTRPFGDEFPVNRNVDVDSTDFRGGVDGKVLGFRLGFTAGYRRFRDNTYYSRLTPHPGVTTTNNAVLEAFNRIYPIKGDTAYGMFTVQRTFAQRLDFTGRFIYSYTDRNFTLDERVFGRDNSNIRFQPDIFFFTGGSQRPQARGDFGLTYAVTNKLRISNTFTFDQFNISGDSRLAQQTFSLTAAGAPRPVTFVNTFYHRRSAFQRLINTIEADYQFSSRFGLNVGYRYSHRKVDITGINRPLAPSTAAPTIIGEEEENSTNTLLVGTRVRPFRNWSIFADVEHGESDNAFTRLSNHTFTNFRVRSNVNYGQFTFNLSAISRDNENPSFTAAIRNAAGVILVPEGELIGRVRSRIFSGFVDWSPDQRFFLSAGYTYHHLTSETDIIVPLAVLTQGYSQYYMRDNYAFIDMSAKPINRVSIFASYRFNTDDGQGDRISTAPQFIVSSYPFRLHMPEVRVAFRLTRNIDWNVGYQYYSYRENLERAHFPPIPPNQNYVAHMPYTSVRIYFGGGDRR